MRCRFEKTLRKRMAATAISVAVTFIIAADAGAAKKRRVVELLEDPKDYSSFERRRQENLDSLNSADQSYFTAFAGRVASKDEPTVTASEYIDDPQASNKLKAIIEDLFPDALEVKPPYEIAFLDSPSFDPFTTSAGALVIPLGFLRQTISKDVLGFVVGHEMSHLLNDDFKLQERKEAINAAAGIVVLGAGLASGSGQVGGDSLKAIRAAQALVVLNELALGPSWGRKQESRADELGFDLAMDVGMSPDGAFGLFETRVEQYRKSEAALDEFCGKKTGIGGLILKGVVEGAIGAPGLLSDNQNPGHPICLQRDSLMSQLLASHPNPEKRLKGLTEYRDEFYADVESTRSQTLYEPDALTAFSPNGPLARLSYARDAKLALDNGDLATAEILAKRSLSGPNDATPNARYVNYLVQKRKGNRKAAIAHLEFVVKEEGTTATLPIYIALADEYAADKQFAKALELINHGSGFHGRAPFLPQIVRFQTALGDSEGAMAALSECLKLKDALIEAQCRAAALPPESADAATVTSMAPAESTSIFARLIRADGAATFLARLETTQNATLFIPDDRALTRLGANYLASLLSPENANLLDAFLSAHLVDGDIAATGIGDKVLQAHTRDALGRHVVIEVDPRSAQVSINGVGVIVGDLVGNNGRIHVIDDVLASP